MLHSVKILIPCLLTFCFFWEKDIQPKTSLEPDAFVGVGIQPAISIDPQNEIRIVFGKKNADASELYYIHSTDSGEHFSKPELLGRFPKMGLGMGRGPQIASTKDYTVVTIGDHFGNLYALSLSHQKNTWSKPVRVNDSDSTAKEALSDLASGKDNNLYAVWLDTRIGKENNLYGSLSTDGGLTWSDNQLIYAGPQHGICECCKPSVAIDKSGNINVMFRNKLDGARNLYLISSKDNGQHFGEAVKLGQGDYLINACPMDGGDLTASSVADISTVWRRQTDIYLAKAGKQEIKLGAGRTPVLLQTAKGTAIAWEEKGEIKFKNSENQNISTLGKGQYPKLAFLPDTQKIICVFERDGQVLAQTIAQ